MLTLVINLNRRPDRLEAMRLQLQRLDLPYERIEAIDARTADEATRTAGFVPGAVSDGDQACTQSHRLAWRRLIESGAPFAAVLEDDTRLGETATALLRDDHWLPAGILLVKLDSFPPSRRRALIGRSCGQLPDGRTLRRLYSRHPGGAAYILSRQAAEILLEPQRPWSVTIDQMLFDPSRSPLFVRLKPFQVLPAVASQSPAERKASDITPIRRRRKTIRSRLMAAWGDMRLLPGQILAALGGARMRTVAPPESNERNMSP